MLIVIARWGQNVVGAAVETHTALEHLENVDVHLLVEANLGVRIAMDACLVLVAAVANAARTLDDAVVVVGAVQSQLKVREARSNHIHAIAEHVIKAIDVNARPSHHKHNCILTSRLPRFAGGILCPALLPTSSPSEPSSCRPK